MEILVAFLYGATFSMNEKVILSINEIENCFVSHRDNISVYSLAFKEDKRVAC